MFAKQRILTILIKQTTFISPVSALSSLTLDLSPHDLKRCHLLLKKKKPTYFFPKLDVYKYSNCNNLNLFIKMTLYNHQKNSNVTFSFL